MGAGAGGQRDMRAKRGQDPREPGWPGQGLGGWVTLFEALSGTNDRYWV